MLKYNKHYYFLLNGQCYFKHRQFKNMQIFRFFSFLNEFCIENYVMRIDKKLSREVNKYAATQTALSGSRRREKLPTNLYFEKEWPTIDVDIVRNGHPPTSALLKKYRADWWAIQIHIKPPNLNWIWIMREIRN